MVNRVIMGANTAGIYGAQLFRQDDKPRYRRGFTVNIAILAFGLGLAIVRYVDDRIRRKKGKGPIALERDSGSENDVQQEGVVAGGEKKTAF
jgi:hypothetical protein